ncbi:UNVERIFIED_CONTAM: hypothetical protein Slati_1118800 [Sesamum latifolium]|uniref:Gag/pol protein n=1 Tax=Sesamum latifolium TaxID=2727402 RepID=A0AAW2XB75_9LAMI
MSKNPLTILETNKFNGTNYNDWLKNLRIVLDFEKQTYVLHKSLPVTLPEGSTTEECVTFERWQEDNRKVRSIVLASMTNDIQKEYDRHDDVASIMLHMKEVYAVPDRHIRYAATKVFFGTKMTEGSSVRKHGIKMLSLVEKLEDLQAGLDNDTYIDVILQSLPPSYVPFVVNYNMNGLEKSINELINIRWNRKKGKRQRPLQALLALLLPQWGLAKVKGRWVPSQSGQMMYVCIAGKRAIGRGSAPSSSPVQVLKRSKKLSRDEVVLKVGNGKAVAVKL